MPTEGATHIADFNVGLPEGSTDQVLIVDDHFNMMKEAIKRDLGGFVGSILLFGESTHTANVYPISLTTSPTTYEKGMILVMKALNANTGPVDVNIASLGDENLKWRDGSEFVSGDIPANAVVVSVYNGSDFIAISNIISASETYADTVAAAAQAAAEAASIPLISPAVLNNAVLQNADGSLKDAQHPLTLITEFLSGQIDIVQGGTSGSLAHNLGGLPTWWMIWLECVVDDTANSGLTVGDFIPYKSGGSFNNQSSDAAPAGLQVVFTTTNAKVRFANKNEILSLLHQSTGGSADIGSTSPESSFKLHVNAWRLTVLP